MSEPPRRRRSASPPRRASRGPSLLPTIALGIGVVVAGLGIGAFLSAVQRSAPSTPLAVPSNGLPVVTPVAQPSRGPVAIATIVGRPTPTPTPSPSASPTAPPSETPTPAATPAPSPTPAPAPTLRPTHPPATPEPPRVIPASLRPATVATVKPATGATAPAAHPPAFGVVAESTVHRYLDALIAGNENGAYAALGAAPGDPNARLSEEAFIDRGTRITALHTTRSDATGATVEAELASAHGTYYATYHVISGPAGPVIDQHDYIRE
jgi:hypothetical protein